MPLIVSSSSTQTAVLNTEHTLLDTAIGGNYALTVNTVNLAGAESVKLRMYNKVLSGSTYAVDEEIDALAGQYPSILRIGPVAAPYGCKATLLQANTGTGRNFDWAMIDLAAPVGVQRGLAQTGTLTTTVMTTNLTWVNADQVKNRAILFISPASNLFQAVGIVQSSTTGGQITFTSALCATPVNNDEFEVL